MAVENGAMETALSEKRASLEATLRALPGAVVAYSGGVDSALLTAAAHRSTEGPVLAVTAVSPSLASREKRSAAELADANGWEHLMISTGEVEREEYARNAPDRCYWCKTELFDVLLPIARARGVPILLGTNLDDLGEHRPGQRAARENGALEPLVEAALTKDDVRSLSRAWGLPTHDKPAAPCLSSRIAYGVRVTPERLRRIDAAEEFVRSLGFDVLRVRDLGVVARVEVPPERVPQLQELTVGVTEELTRLGWDEVLIDPVGYRRGAMNEILTNSIGIGQDT